MLGWEGVVLSGMGKGVYGIRCAYSIFTSAIPVYVWELRNYTHGVREGGLGL